MHDLGKGELVVDSWHERRDKAREAVFAWAKTYLKWGQAPRIPSNLVSSFLRCDVYDRPGDQASHVAWNRVLFCDKHIRARNRALTKTLAWRMKVEEDRRVARDEQTIFKGL